MFEHEAATVWEQEGLPASLTGMTFVDIGCWEGYICGEAVRRGAAHVLGVDYCTAESIKAYRQRVSFDFIQMDMFSEKFLQLPEYDIVHSAGVLYHTESPLGFLMRLRKICRLGGWVYVESTLMPEPCDKPYLVFHPGSELDNNPSNWWSPNELCLHDMMKASGFTDVETTFIDRSRPIQRVTVRGRAANSPARLSLKVLPRRPSFMPDAGFGDRH